VSDEPKYRDEEWLREQYVERERSTYDIAEECGCVARTISKWLDRNDIEARSRGTVTDKRLTNEEWLRKQYVEEEKSTVEIAEECECARSTVCEWLERYDVTTRKGRPAVDDRLTDEEWLRIQYVEKKRSTCEIADECGCADPTVGRWLERFNIEKRDRSRLPPDDRLTDEEWLREQYVEKERTQTEIANECGCSGRTVGRWLRNHKIETRPGKRPAPDDRLTDEEWLREQYVEEERSTYDIAEECDCSTFAVGNWLNKHGINTRDPTFREGESHRYWNGGRQPYGPGFGARKKREVRERDDHTCQDPTCSVTQDDHLAQYDEKLHVHHLIKARDVDDPEERNAAENLITLCRDCHQRWERMAEAGIRPQIDGVTGD
jgi:transposase